jgi:hypothetical protein
MALLPQSITKYIRDCFRDECLNLHQLPVRSFTISGVCFFVGKAWKEGGREGRGGRGGRRVWYGSFREKEEDEEEKSPPTRPWHPGWFLSFPVA